MYHYNNCNIGTLIYIWLSSLMCYSDTRYSTVLGKMWETVKIEKHRIANTLQDFLSYLVWFETSAAPIAFNFRTF